MAAKQKEEVVDSSEDEADSFDNYGVFQSDYEFKFVQEGNDKTTLMLPPVTYDSMEVKYFNVEIEVDSELLVSALEKEKTVNGTTRFFFRIAKSGGQLGQGDDGEAYEKLGEDGYDYGEMKDKAEVQAKKPKGKNPKARAPMDAHNYSKQKVMVKSAPTIKVESEELPTMNLDGTQLDDEEEEEEEDEGEDVEDDGDDDDDMDDLEEIEMLGDASLAEDDQTGSPRTPKRKKPKQEPTSSGKKRRKYDKTNYYSKESTNFSVEMTDEGDRFFKCTHCKYNSPKIGNMKMHVRRHTGERPFSCDMCIKTFTCGATLKLHKRSIHCEERSEICEYCHASFKTRQNLKTHQKRHFDIKKHLCPFCGKRMANKMAMEAHVNTHTKSQKYMCGICDKMVSSDSAMKRHMLLHTGGNVKCHLCSKTFVRKEIWRKHMINEHKYSGNEDILGKRQNQVQKVI
ncbi:zinc finger protein 691-like isoform X5 [Ruditapes philippinarum]|uniref:zinc finger protein 691-like isoform X5 n=1 Tax=Ruditapes philippinarum TaxID=129788 RepID=UPI00295B8601|nr:zinc finger protein 691-like isoform X5 [Ruditapes philippinarum]